MKISLTDKIFKISIIFQDDPTFKDDFLKFQDRILELDLKLAAILCQAFDDCHNLESVFKLISIAGSVLDRPKIKEQFTSKYFDILQMLDEEITMCEEIFESQMNHFRREGTVFVERSAPVVTAGIRFSQQLGQRVTAPIKCFKALQHP